jgi:hypothetical protein
VTPANGPAGGHPPDRGSPPDGGSPPGGGNPPGHGPPPGRATSRRLLRIVGSVGLVAVLTAAGIAVVDRVQRPARPRFQANARPSRLATEPSRSSGFIVAPDGARTPCPSGAVPAVTLQEAAFQPPLSDGQSFTAGTYQIRLRGLVVNETTAAITVQSYVVTIGGDTWPVSVKAPDTLRPGVAEPITVEGSYHNGAARRADIAVSLRWTWNAVVLQPCGERGLIEDD